MASASRSRRGTTGRSGSSGGVGCTGCWRHVSTIHGERVEITSRDNTPLRFVWRGRLYGVLAVLEHWVISSQWWQRNNPDTGVPPARGVWRGGGAPGGKIPPPGLEHP